MSKEWSIGSNRVVTLKILLKNVRNYAEKNLMVVTSPQIEVLETASRSMKLYCNQYEICVDRPRTGSERENQNLACCVSVCFAMPEF